MLQYETGGCLMYRDFTRWLFDGNPLSPIPNEQDMLKYNSPITHGYILQCLLPHSLLTTYLNDTFNSYDLFKLNKKEFLLYIKHLVLKLNITRNFFNYRGKRDDEKNELYKQLLKKLPELKKDDISLLADIIDNLDEIEKESYYASLGLSVPKKRKLSGKRKKEKIKKISLEEYMNKFFNIM